MRQVVVFFLVLLAAVAGAEPRVGMPRGGRTDGDRILAIVANESEKLRPKVAAVIVDQQRRLGGCTTLKRLDAEDIWVVQDVALFDSGKPARGSWQVRYKAQLCGESVERNVVFKAGVDGIALQAETPGSTLVDPQLGADVWKSFQMVVIKADPSCRNPLLKETQILDRPAHVHDKWRELWVAKVCGREMAQVVVFYPSRAGTLFRMTLPKAPVTAMVSRTVP